MNINNEYFDTDKLISIFDNLPGYVFITDGVGRVIYVSPLTLESFGLPRSEIIGMESKELLRLGLLKRSTTLEAIRDRKVVIGKNVTNKGKEVLNITMPIFDEDDNISIVMTYQFKHNYPDVAIIKDNKNSSPPHNVINENKKIICSCEAMQQIYAKADIIAPSDSSIIIYGESGTGKEILANYIHENSNRSLEPFISVNCSAIPRELMESEFFGYGKGAFTGANKEGKKGLFEAAQNGTLFLDEIGELPIELQPKLLRALDSGTITRIGEICLIKTNVRIICATNKDLINMVQKGLFRADLYYRLNVIPLFIPPLRERVDEIGELAELFLHNLNQKYFTHKQLSLNAIEMLKQYCWPGNIRELRNAMERLFMLTTQEQISTKDIITNNILLPQVEFDSKENMVQQMAKTNNKSVKDGNIIELYKEEEKNRVLNALNIANGNKTTAAKILGISRGKLYKLLERWSI